MNGKASGLDDIAQMPLGLYRNEPAVSTMSPQGIRQGEAPHDVARTDCE